MPGNLFSSPTSSYGYYRGAPMAGGQGSGAGPSMQGTSAFSAGQGPAAGPGGWHPTVIYMGGLILLEMVVFAFISKKL
jgi:hypothetical protein